MGTLDAEFLSPRDPLVLPRDFSKHLNMYLTGYHASWGRTRPFFSFCQDRTNFLLTLQGTIFTIPLKEKTEVNRLTKELKKSYV